jgi:hypothetical protein
MREAGGAGRTAEAISGKRLYGYAVEFETVGDLLQACRRVRDAGYMKWDAYTPFPVHGLNDAMGIRHTRLPMVVLGGGLTGAALGLLMQWWMNAVDYKFIISGKPFFGLPANIPITFELTILLSAICAFIGMLAFNGLPQYFHPIFRSELHKRATSDRFVICIEAADPKFDVRGTEAFLESLGGSPIEAVEVE